MADLPDLVVPPTPTARVAVEVLTAWASPALINHCLRSWLWAADLAARTGPAHDAELLFVAAMLHDLGVTERFDAVAAPFENAGGAVAWTFAAGAGWPAARRRRVEQVVQRHAWARVDPDLDPEGYLLEAATSLDVAGAGAQRWDAAYLRAVSAAVPRLDFGAQFGAAMAEQARRKPSSEAARFVRGDGVGRGERFWAQLLDG